LYKQSVNLSKAVILNKSAKNKSKSSTGPLPSKNIDVKSISKKTLCDITSLMNQVLELTIFL
jgi:hypothetical protein